MSVNFLRGSRLIVSPFFPVNSHLFLHFSHSIPILLICPMFTNPANNSTFSSYPSLNPSPSPYLSPILSLFPLSPHIHCPSIPLPYNFLTFLPNLTPQKPSSHECSPSIHLKNPKSTPNPSHQLLGSLSHASSFSLNSIPSYLPLRSPPLSAISSNKSSKELIFFSLTLSGKGRCSLKKLFIISTFL